jgi:hypothetical protein
VQHTRRHIKNRAPEGAVEVNREETPEKGDGVGTPQHLNLTLRREIGKGNFQALTAILWPLYIFTFYFQRSVNNHIFCTAHG